MISSRNTLCIKEGYQYSLNCSYDADVINSDQYEVRSVSSNGISPMKLDFEFMFTAVENVQEFFKGCSGCSFKREHRGELIDMYCFNFSDLHRTYLELASGQPEKRTALLQDLNFSHYNSTINMINRNSTIMFSTTAVASASSSRQLGHFVADLYAFFREQLLTILGPPEKSDHCLDEQSGSPGRSRWPLIGPFGVLAVLLGACYYQYRKELNRERNLHREQDDGPHNV